MLRPDIAWILLDFGGVIADEGFEMGLKAIACRFLLDPDNFLATATELVYSTGFVTGKATESDFWAAVRKETGIEASDQELTREILSRFVVREPMIRIVEKLRQSGYRTAILSDQSDWLDRLEKKYPFFKYFDEVFNSYHLGKVKRDATIFHEIAQALQIEPAAILFVDDNTGHVERAAQQGMRTHLFRSVEGFNQELEQMGIFL